MNNDFETLAKLLLPEGAAKNFIERNSKAKTTYEVMALCERRSRCMNIYNCLLNNFIPICNEIERKQQLEACQREIAECDHKLQEIMNKTALELFFPKMKQ
jgi:hypothetical protein